MAKIEENGIEALAQQADNLGSMGEVEGQGQGQGEGGAAPEMAPMAPSNAEIIAGGVQMLRDVLCMVLDIKSPQHTLHDANCQKLGGLWGAVADKRGVDLNAMMGDYAAEVAAVIGTVVIGKAVLAAGSAELAAKQPVDAAEKEPEQAGVVVEG